MSTSVPATRQFCIAGDVDPDGGRLGRLVVAGRCWKGPIPVGTVFTTIATLQPDGSWATASSGSLTVEEISLYGHLVDELDEGLTASIVLIGKAERHLAPSDVLAARE